METNISQRTVALRPTVLSAMEVQQTSSRPLGSLAGVENQVLWSDESTTAGILTVHGGHSLGAHTHRTNHHHFWVLSGEAVVLGRRLDPGSYVHIPSGIEHDIDASDSEGCTVYYLYLRPADQTTFRAE